MFKVGIIGAGSIGALKPDDIDNVDGPPLTHANAVTQNPSLEIGWIFDTDFNKMKIAEEKWSVCRDTPETTPVDIIVISSPTETHLNMIQKIMGDEEMDIQKLWEYKPKLIILEKPAGVNIHEATRIDYLKTRAHIPIIVNYGRRFTPKIVDTLNEIEIKKEKLQNIVCYYTRGLLRDCSHMIDMLNLFAGSFLTGRLNSLGAIDDHSKNDLTYGGMLVYTRCPHIFLCPCDGKEFDIFEIQVTTDKGRYTFCDHFKVIQLNYFKDEPIYGNYKSYNYVPRKFIDTKLEYSLTHLYTFIKNYLTSEVPNMIIPCTMTEAIRTHNVIDKLLLDIEMRLK